MGREFKAGGNRAAQRYDTPEGSVLHETTEKHSDKNS